MSLQDYLRVLREQWLVIASAVAVAVIAATIVTFVRPVEYTATSTLYVSAQGSGSVGSAYEGAQLSQQRVSSYMELIGGTRVSREVIERLGLETTPDQLAERITASSPPEAVLIEVAATAESPEQAMAVANAVGEVSIGLVAQLEQPATPGQPPPVAVRVVQPATLPDSRSSPGLLFMLALGALAGLAVGVAAALGRNALDNSVKSPERLREAAGVSILGTVPYHATAEKRPLTVHHDPQSPQGEAFRQLRTNLQFVDVDRSLAVIAVTSSLPSEGKSTTVCNLAIALGAAERSTLVIDADLRRPSIADLLGLEGSVGLTGILAGRVTSDQAIQHWAGGNVDVLTSGPLPPNPSELLASKHMHALLRKLRERYDLILVDTPPLLPVTDAAAIAPATDGAILVCKFKQTSQAQVRNAVEALTTVSAPLLGTVFTMVRRRSRAAATYTASYRNDVPPARGKENALRHLMMPLPGRGAHRQPGNPPEPLRVERRTNRTQDHASATNAEQVTSTN